MLLTVASRAVQLVAQPVQAIGEARGYRLDGLLLRLLPEALVLHEDAVDGVEQRLLLAGGQVHPIAHPLMQVGAGLRRAARVDVEALTHSHACRPTPVPTTASNDVPS